MNSKKQVLLLNLIKGGVAYKGNMYDVHKFFDMLRSILVKRIAADKKIYSQQPSRLDLVFSTILFRDFLHRSVTISILPLSTDLLIVAYAGHFKQ